MQLHNNGKRITIIATLKEYCTTLFGTKLHIHTDHKNLTYENAVTSQVHHWRLLIEEFGPNIEYIKGEANFVALFRPNHNEHPKPELTPLDLAMKSKTPFALPGR